MTSLRRTSHRASVWPLLVHGGWKTNSELLQGAGGRIRILDTCITDLIEDHKVLATDTPGSGKIMYHRTTPETRHLAGQEWYVDFQELPWTLKRSLFTKLYALNGNESTRHEIPLWAKSFLAAETHLDDMGLCDARPRPNDQFIFPCWWRAVYNPELEQWLADRQHGNYTFDLSFTEVIPISVAAIILQEHLPRDMERFRGGHLGCEVTMRKEFMILEVHNIARVWMTKGKLRRGRCPSRRAIIAATATRLRHAASQWGMLKPFVPIMIRQEFELIRQQERRTQHEK